MANIDSPSDASNPADGLYGSAGFPFQSDASAFQDLLDHARSGSSGWGESGPAADAIQLPGQQAQAPTPAPAQGGSILFGHKPEPDDIHQNQLDDCYLDSSMGEMALKDPDAVRKMVHDNKNGTYDVTLHQPDNGPHNLWGALGNGYKDQTITVTPKLHPGAINSQLPDPVQVKGSHELWPQLVEQAYAQQQGGFPNIDSGHWPSKAMESLTGQDAKETKAASYSFSQLRSDFDSGKMVVLNTKELDQGPSDPLNLASSHAYMVTGISDTPQGQVVTLQNPWGKGTSGLFPAEVKALYAQVQPHLTTASVGTTH